MLRGSNSECLASLFYTYTVLCTCNWQTSDPNDSSSTRSSLFIVQIRTWGHWETGNLPEITEQLSGKGRTQATENDSTVRTLVSQDPHVSWRPIWVVQKRDLGYLLLWVWGRATESLSIKRASQPSVILSGSSVGANLMSSPPLLSSHLSHMLMLFLRKVYPQCNKHISPYLSCFYGFDGL